MGGKCLCSSKGRLHWWIVGGESGDGARTMDGADARLIVSNCQRDETPVFVKQMGAAFFDRETGLVGRQFKADPVDRFWVRKRLADGKGARMSEWPEALQVREQPKHHVAQLPRLANQRRIKGLLALAS
jgi:hypothetical protein